METIALVYSSLYALASFFRNNMYNRMFLVFGSMVHLILLLYFADSFSLPVLFLVIALIFGNGVHMIYYVNRNLGYNLNQRDLEMKEMIFDFMDKADFKQLINAGNWKKSKKDEFLIEENQILERLILIYKGKANVFKGEEKIASLEAGNFAGEMSFMTAMKTNADVVAAEDLEYIEWERNSIVDLMDENESLELGLYAVLNKDLISKLKNQKM